MSKSVGIVLTATGISFANEWMQTNTPNLRVPIAGLGVALLFNGVERLNERAGVGLATIMLITVLFTPFQGKSPLQTLGAFAQQDPKQKRVK